VSTGVALRLVLYEGETYRVARSAAAVRIRDGAAWVSYAGSDTVLVLQCGEELPLQSGRDFAVISTLGHAELVLEVLVSESGRRQSTIRRPVRSAVRC
jgi:hypothetical protein